MAGRTSLEPAFMFLPFPSHPVALRVSEKKPGPSCLTGRSTPDPTLTMSQFSIEPHQYSLYAPIVRLGSGRSTLALGPTGAPAHETQMCARSH